jgi:hypothetical protein
MLRIINQALDTDWVEVKLGRIYLNGVCQFWTRGGGVFQIRQKDTTNYLTIDENEKKVDFDLISKDNIIFEARVTADTDTLEMIVQGEYYVNYVTGDPPSGEWVTNEYDQYVLDMADDFVYA